MAAGRSIEVPLYNKSPFANYDLVVYLGGGLFALFVFWRYVVVPFKIFDDLQILGTNGSDAWSVQALFLLGGGILAYTVGHLVAYLSSHFIEGFVNRTLGSFSEIIKRSSKPRDEFDNENRSAIIDNCRRNFTFKKGVLIWLAHAPIGLWYWGMAQFALFDSIDTRLPQRMIQKLGLEIKAKWPEVDIDDERQWFRWVEYYTNYNSPIASASMYNYLIISGFMRSVSLVILAAIWLEFIHLFYAWVTGDRLIHIEESAWLWAFHVSLLYVGIACALTSYTKFYRRYVEEAILGFLLEPTPAPIRQREGN